MQLERITVVPGVCEGRPTIRGLRLRVEFVLKLLGSGYTADDIAREYPELQREDVLQAARYGSWLASQRRDAAELMLHARGVAGRPVRRRRSRRLLPEVGRSANDWFRG